MRKKLIIFGALALATSQTLANASSVDVTSLPQGMLVVTASVGSTTYLSLPLSNNAIFTGTVASVNSNAIATNLSPGPFTMDLANPAWPYFVKFLSGSEVGRTLLITGSTASTLNLNIGDNTAQQVSLLTSGFSVKPGDAFEVVPADTLATIFGTGTAQSPLTLTGSSNYATADWVNVFNPTTGSWQVYYFNTSANCWALEGSTTNVNSTVLYPYRGLSITRHSATEPTASLVLTGRVAEVPVMTKTIGSNAVVYGSTGYPVGMKLSQLNFGSNWVKGTSTATADVIGVWNSSTKTFQDYYELPSNSWRLSGNTTTDQSNVVVPAGDCISLQQHTSVSGSTSYLPSSMPYTLANF